MLHSVRTQLSTPESQSLAQQPEERNRELSASCPTAAPVKNVLWQAQESECIQQASDPLLEALRFPGVARRRDDGHVDIGTHQIDDVLRVRT